MEDNKLLTTEELAERWQMKASTLANWRNKRKGPKYIKVGRNVRYNLEHIQEFEEKREELQSDIKQTNPARVRFGGPSE